MPGKITPYAPAVITIGGLDPCGGAGISADCRTLERCGTVGFPVATVLTFQTENKIWGVEWLPFSTVKRQLLPLLKGYNIAAVKLSLFRQGDDAICLLELLRKHLPHIPIVWDTVRVSSSQFTFLSQKEKVKEYTYDMLDCITPNTDEAEELLGSSEDKDKIQMFVRKHRCRVLITGKQQKGKVWDRLYNGKEEWAISSPPIQQSKHGSGCLFSSSLIAAKALGKSWEEAAQKAHQTTHQFLRSTKGLLGFIKAK